MARRATSGEKSGLRRPNDAEPLLQPRLLPLKRLIASLLGLMSRSPKPGNPWMNCWDGYARRG